MSVKALALAAIAATSLPAAVMAQNTLSVGLGPQSAPEYFGSENNEVGVAGSLSLQQLNFGPLALGGAEGGAAQGLGFRGSFRFINERTGRDYRELAGTRDVDAALELGGGVTYTANNFDVFALARYGVVGHESFVGELGGDAIFRPTPQVELRVGPRLFYGDDDYAQTYFGVTDTEAAASLAANPGASLASFDADGGLLSRGIEASAAYAFSEDWGVKGTIRYDEYTNSAADSPIVRQGSDTATTASIIVTRRFSF